MSELQPLIEMLGGYQLAIEFRNRNWTIGDQLAVTIDFVREHGAIFVNVDTPASDHFTVMPSDLDEVTNPSVAYLRLHGRNAKAFITGKTVAARFDYDYNEEEIAEVAERSRKLAKEAREVHAIFNNNNLDYAPSAALRLRKALGQIVDAPPETPRAVLDSAFSPDLKDPRQTHDGFAVRCRRIQPGQDLFHFLFGRKSVSDQGV